MLEARLCFQSTDQHSHTYLAKMPTLKNNLITSVMQTAVVEKYSSVSTVLVYRSATVYAAATRVITVRQYNLNSKLTFSEEKKKQR